MDIRKQVKRAVGSAWLRVPPTRSRLARQGTVLMLHRVLASDTEADLPHRRALCIGAGAFDRLLGWLTRYFDCVPLEELLKRPAGQRPRLSLTFDDGWHDNAEQAFPLLQRYRVPASIFLATDFIGTSRRFWWEAIGESLWQYSDGCRALLRALEARGCPVPAEIRRAEMTAVRSRAIAAYLQQIKQLSPSLLDELVVHCPPQPHRDALSWEQITAMESSGLVRFGSHGAAHAILTHLDDQALQADIERSAAVLRGRCQRPLEVFCYPNGDLDSRVRTAIAKQGYSQALGTRPGFIAPGVDPLALPRIDVSHAAARWPGLLGWRLMQGAPG